MDEEPALLVGEEAMVEEAAAVGSGVMLGTKESEAVDDEATSLSLWH